MACRNMTYDDTALFLKAMLAMVAVPGSIIGSYILISNYFMEDAEKIDSMWLLMCLIIIFLFII